MRWPYCLSIQYCNTKYRYNCILQYFAFCRNICLSRVMSNFAPRNKDICNYYFTLEAGSSTVFKCECGNKRNKTSTSRINLMEHIRKVHPNYLEEMKHNIDSSSGLLTSFVHSNTKKIYKWLKFIVVEGVPFDWYDKTMCVSSANSNIFAVKRLKSIWTP